VIVMLALTRPATRDIGMQEVHDMAQRSGMPSAHARFDAALLADWTTGIDGRRAAVRPEERACCCSAPPAVRVVFVHASPAVHSVDLLMCGHHYRQSAAKLADIGAMIFDRKGYLLPADRAALCEQDREVSLTAEVDASS
jgi:hypothetical protein